MKHITQKDIAALPTDRPVAVIIRHAERFDITNMDDAFKVPLTPQGKEDAYNLGSHFADIEPVSFLHSPVDRCQDTAEQMYNALKEKSVSTTMIGRNEILGGPYAIGTWKEITREIDSLGHEEFLRTWFDGHYDNDLMLSIKEAAHLTMRLLLKSLDKDNESTIHVTHDWNIMIIREHIFGIKHEDVGVPHFLDGCFFWFQGQDLVCTYHNEEIKLTPADLKLITT